MKTRPVTSPIVPPKAPHVAIVQLEEGEDEGHFETRPAEEAAAATTTVRRQRNDEWLVLQLALLADERSMVLSDLVHEMREALEAYDRLKSHQTGVGSST